MPVKLETKYTYIIISYRIYQKNIILSPIKIKQLKTKSCQSNYESII